MRQTTDTTRQAPGLDLDTTAERLDAALDTLRCAVNQVQRLRDQVQHAQLRGRPVAVRFGNVHMRPWKHGMPCTRCGELTNAVEWFLTERDQPSQDNPVCPACTERDDPDTHTLYQRLVVTAERSNRLYERGTAQQPEAMHEVNLPNYEDGYYLGSAPVWQVLEAVAGYDHAAVAAAVEQWDRGVTERAARLGVDVDTPDPESVVLTGGDSSWF